MYTLSLTCQIPDLDKIYTKYFGEDTNRIFVEVGAFDGESVSNTSCLADAGWRGYYIEPVREHFDQCIQRHKKNLKVTVSNISIGTKEDYQTVYCSGIVSTLDKKQAEFVSSMSLFGYPQYKEQQCWQLKLESYLEKSDIPKNFDLLVVDVEGREEDVFNSFDLNEWSPKMMIVELIDDHEYFQDNITLVESCKKLRSYINNNGYTEVFHDHINTIFVRDEYITGNTNL